MSLNAATIEILIAKGLSASDILEVAKATEVKKDTTNAERQARHRARRRNTVTVTDAPPNDIYSNPQEPISAKADTAPFVGKVQEAWNGTAQANGLDTVRKIAGTRLKHLMARRKEHGEEAVFEAIGKLGRSDWHCGRSGEWKADFNWLFGSPRNFEKILERTDGGHAKASRPMTAQELQNAIRFNTDQGDLKRAEDLKRQLAELRAQGPPPVTAKVIREAAESLRASR